MATTLDTRPFLATIDDHPVGPSWRRADPLVRATINSLFSWARALPDDDLSASSRMGWWGDTYPAVNGDRYGSRLWLLTRSRLTDDVVNRAREYADEALRWLVEDGVARRVDVTAERLGHDGIAIACRITRNDGTMTAMRFTSAWEAFRV